MTKPLVLSIALNADNSILVKEVRESSSEVSSFANKAEKAGDSTEELANSV